MMMREKSKREAFLTRVRSRLPGALLPEAGAEHPGVFQGYGFQADTPAEILVERFAAELRALSGRVHILADVEEVGAKTLEIIQKHQARRVLTWDETALETPWLNQALIEAGISVVQQQLPAAPAERKAQLNEIEDVVIGLTGAQAGLAETGTIAIVSGPERGRLASLLPPVHIAILARNKIYPALPAFLTAQPDIIAEGSNLVFITGPSRSGDIEMTLSMGVHGPGEIHVIITP
jgi:L-lactate dehydrogenase complex protein LldG